MEFKAILSTEIGLLSEAEIAGGGSPFHPAENKARQDVALLQSLRRTAKAGASRLHHCFRSVGSYLNMRNISEWNEACNKMLPPKSGLVVPETLRGKRRTLHLCGVGVNIT